MNRGAPGRTFCVDITPVVAQNPGMPSRNTIALGATIVAAVVVILAFFRLYWTAGVLVAVNMAVLAYVWYHDRSNG